MTASKEAIEAAANQIREWIWAGSGLSLEREEALKVGEIVANAVLSAALADEPVGAVEGPIKGLGFDPNGGGFASVMIGDRTFSAEEVRGALSVPPAAPVVAGPDLQEYYERQITWSRETFGPALRTKGVIDHIRKELREIEQEPHDLSEWIDVVILAMDGFWRHGGNAADLLPALLAKQKKNMARDWPDWRTMSEDHAIEHDRSKDATATDTGEDGGEPVAMQWHLERIREEVLAGRKQNALTYLSCALAVLSRPQPASTKALVDAREAFCGVAEWLLQRKGAGLTKADTSRLFAECQKQRLAIDAALSNQGGERG